MIAFDATYAKLADRFFAKVKPTPVEAPRALKVNAALAEALGIDAKWLASDEGVAVLAGNAIAAGSEPIALAYAGHQFGHFVPQLGDGRAILLGEVVAKDGKRYDVQLKGAGRTPFSRGGDGRAALGPVLREYVVSEAMFALGIPTTRSLAAVATGEPVARETLLPGAIVTRVASSHLRVGTFEYFAARRDEGALATLVRYALDRHYPDAKDAPRPALALLERVIAAQARLVAQWLGVGFVHGVMNTDNTTIAGETIDFGPCAFLDEFDPGKVFSSIDHGGRYAFGNQPRILAWNMGRLASALLPLLGDDEDEAVRAAQARLDEFGPRFGAAYADVLRAKLGVAGEDEPVHDLARDLLGRMAASAVDYAVFFRALCDAAEDAAHDAKLAAMFDDPSAFTTWAAAWRASTPSSTEPRARAAAMRRANPAFIPRNHRVEEAIAAATQDDLAPFHRLVDVLSRPYDDQPEAADLATPPRPEERVTRTFCGT